jgi:CO dehydrogenase/acetyl-CoA synthase alpha subunit
MTTHFKVHQGIHRPINKTHKCLICQLTFPRKLKLDEHMKVAHQAIDLKVDETEDVDMTKEELSSLMLRKSIASLALPHMFAPN